MCRVAVLLVLLAGAARADTVTGYDHGAKIKLRVTDVDGVAVEAHTAKAFRAMAKSARKAGVQLKIRSGFRTYEQQKKLYTAYQQGRGNLAAPPGESDHENGRALDLELSDPDARGWLAKHAASYGFRRTVGGEPWHWEFSGEVATATRTARTSHGTTR